MHKHKHNTQTKVRVIYLEHRQCTVFTITRAGDDLQVRLRVALKLSEEKKLHSCIQQMLLSKSIFFKKHFCTSSDKNAGSPIEALAQGPMLRMLSHTYIRDTKITVNATLSYFNIHL